MASSFMSCKASRPRCRGLGVTNGRTAGAGGRGGGIDNAGTLTITNSEVHHNSAYSGGGIFNQGTLNIANSEVHHNSALSVGGGISNDQGAPLTITDCDLHHNRAKEGGGIDIYGTLAIANSEVHHSNAQLGGGGISDQGTLIATNTTVCFNTPDDCVEGVDTPCKEPLAPCPPPPKVQPAPL
jgi:hypothetical protein